MYNILIVEDEINVRRGIIQTTDWAAYHVDNIYEASHGLDALKLITKRDIDIVITDIKMPVMDGMTMLSKIKDINDYAIIVVTAFDEFEFAQQAIKFGVVDFLVKPFTDNELDAAITKAIKKVEEIERLNIKNKINYIDSLVEELSAVEYKPMRDALNYIHNNYSCPDLSIQSLADHLEVSESFIVKMFQQRSTLSFNEYVTQYRIKKARELLDNTNLMIYEVSEQVGYTDSRYFSSVFKKHLKISPNQYRNKKKFS